MCILQGWRLIRHSSLRQLRRWRSSAPAATAFGAWFNTLYVLRRNGARAAGERPANVMISDC